MCSDCGAEYDGVVCNNCQRKVEDRDDWEANEFAMELLMPTKLLLKDIGEGIEIGSDKLKKLAMKYQVDREILTIRVGQLLERFRRKR